MATRIFTYGIISIKKEKDFYIGMELNTEQNINNK